jgi:hypothetical protein
MTGIGATTTIFSVGNGLLNKAIHGALPERLRASTESR